ncbi:MAG: methylenetetrahydrofolate--tRNA-(uracil(54)-C(5))-methyltransferase (FADH(2)-oxidizing) TrmFO [Alphaproteobacteria bacterium]
MNKPSVAIIGGGLAGCEAAWQLALRDINVIIYEMRGKKPTFAHKTDYLAELVCSNSLRSDDYENSAIGVLHEEMRRLNSLILTMADKHSVPAGGALAVDRDNFAADIQNTLSQHPNITIIREEVTDISALNADKIIIATGPLTSEAMQSELAKLTGDEFLHFFDAIAPTIYTQSIDMSKAWFQSRYDKGTGKDYINCPLSEEQYNKFIDDLVEGEKVAFKDWEKDTPYFEGCLPIEVMAERGRKTLSFGPLKPVGLTNPHNPEVKPYAIVQLRQDNKQASIYNMVGFQTKLTYGEQKRIFKKIPGLEAAEFARLGGIHRNCFVCSPKVLDKTLAFHHNPNIRLAGQVSGCEGYVESASMGLLCGIFTAFNLLEKEIILPPPQTAIGAMLAHVTTPEHAETYQPMNINFGLLQDGDFRNEKGRRLKGRLKKQAYCKQALEFFDKWKSKAI